MPKVPIFAKNAHILVPKNDTSGAQTKILRPPKNDGIAIGFKRLPLLDGF